MNQKPKYVAKLGNVYFVNKLGISLRQATAGVIEDQLPKDVRRALRHLDRLEFLRTFIEPKRDLGSVQPLRCTAPLPHNARQFVRPSSPAPRAAPVAAARD